jgi:small nuclear ribonucleoprotein (snRNP)-like protein
MSFPRRHHFKRRERHPERESQTDFFDQSIGVHNRAHPEHTGSEPDYLKSLVDSRARVTVVLKTGELLRGRIRYYDQHCFSLGLAGKGPRLFIRKENVAYISEEKPAADSQPSPPPDPDVEFS